MMISIRILDTVVPFNSVSAGPSCMRAPGGSAMESAAVGYYAMYNTLGSYNVAMGAGQV